MKTISENFAENMRIDRYALDEECELQASLYPHYGESYADAKAEKDREKDKLDLTLAQREMAVRQDAAASGIKTTEATISAMLAQDFEVVKQKEVYRIACEKLYHLDVAMGALDNRRGQLDNLVRLSISSYFSSKSADSTASAEYRQKLNQKE